MRGTGSRAYARSIPVPKMPPGLVELMEGLSKEVLRNEPENIYEFCTAHILKLMEIRDANSFSKNVVSLDRRIQLIQERLRKKAAEKIQVNTTDLDYLHNLQDESVSKSGECVFSLNNDKSKPNKINHNKTTTLHQELILTGDSEIEISHDINTDTVNNKLLNIKSEDTDLQSSIVVTNVDDVTESSLLKSKNLTNETTKDIVDISNTTMLKTCTEIKNQDDTNIHSLVPNDIAEETFFSKQDASLLEVKNQDENNSKTFETSGITNHNNIVMDSMHIQTDIDFKKLPEKQTDILNNDLKSINKDSLEMEFKKKVEKSSENLDCNIENETCISHDVSIIDEKLNLQDNQQSNINENIQDLQSNLLSKCDKNPLISTDTSGKSLENSLSSEQEQKAMECSSKSESNQEPIFKTELEVNVEPVTVARSDTFCDNEDPNSRVIEANSNMDLETAAITIQKVFRSFLFKSRASTCDSNDENNSIDEDSEKKELSNFTNLNLVKDRRGLGLTRMDTVLQTVNEEKSLSLSTDDSSTLSSAATVIQAHVRGFLVRNKFKSNKTSSTSSVPNLDLSSSLHEKAEVQKSKTILNIHIVPDSTVPNLSRDESILTSMELSLDGSPPSSVNLHPLGYNKSEPRKQLKREDAIQSVSPPSNNSGKLSEDVDSVKEALINDVDIIKSPEQNIQEMQTNEYTDEHGTLVENIAVDPVHDTTVEEKNETTKMQKTLLRKMTSDEMDVVTPFTGENKKDETTILVNSGELHDAVLPTKVLRNDTTVVRGE